MSYLTLPLAPDHIKAPFDCGNAQLNRYLHQQAKQDVQRQLAACFVLLEGAQTVKGYYTLSSAGIRRDILPAEIIRKLPNSYSDLPVTLLGRLAVDLSMKGKGLGAQLLVDALRRSYMTSVTSVGSMAVVVDPIDAAAIAFYAKYGFITLPDSGKMFIPMDAVAKLFR